MSKKWTPERAKADTESKILAALGYTSPLRWSELLERTRLSSRTLKKALDRMETEGLVYRKIDTGKGYPPPVHYGLTPEGKQQNIPSVFAMALWTEIFRPSRAQIFQSDADLEIALKNLGRTLGATYLFAVLKSLEYNDLGWLDKLHEGLIDYRLFDHTVVHRFQVSKGLGKTREGEAEGKSLTGLMRPVTIPPLDGRDIRKMQVLLKKSYPDVIGKIEDWFKKCEVWAKENEELVES